MAAQVSQAARRYLAPVVILALGAGGSWYVREHRPSPPPAKIGLAKMPLAFGDFQGRELPTDKSVFAYLGADEMIDRLYIDQTTHRSVTLSVVFARGWRALHSPQHCLKNQGWRLLENVKLDLPSADGQAIHAGSMVMDTASERIAVVYTFTTSSATTASWLRHSLRMAVGQGGKGGALIVAIAPSPSPKEDDATLGSAAAVVQEAHNYLVRNWGAEKG